jgi:hypothetical protein
MNIFDLMRQSTGMPGAGGRDALGLLEAELSEALSLYWETAQEILWGSGITLLEKPAGFLKLDNNFFSAIFLYSYHRAGLPRDRRVLHAALNHCLRGMVTGCDNILDNEYKKTLETDLPAGATRFRSIIDIMASDRVLFSIVMAANARNELSTQQVLQASTASLHALTASGIQEATEEQGIGHILLPADVLSKVHHYKTGLLFNCTWAIPEAIGDVRPGAADSLKEALYRIGIGCQIMDDMADLGRDVREKRHNYIASLVYHEGGPQQWNALWKNAAGDSAGRERAVLLLEFPQALQASARLARQYLCEGLSSLFADSHQMAVEPAIAFLYRRIGTEHLMAAAGLSV